MSKVHVSLRREDGTPTRAPISGAIRFAPSKRRTAGADVILPAGFDAQLVDGEAIVELDATGPDWCWTAYEPTLRGAIRNVLVPDVSDDEVLEYSSLPDVDPATLAPSEDAVPAWTAVVGVVSGHAVAAGTARAEAEQAAADATQSTIDAETAAGRAEGYAAAAQTSASDALGYAGAASNSAGAALSSALASAESAGDASADADRAEAAAAAAAAATVTTGEVVGDDLILTRTDESTVNAGSVRGPRGEVTSLGIGTVTTTEPGGAATAEITGEAPNQTLNLALPRGPIGPVPSHSWAGTVLSFEGHPGVDLQGPQGSPGVVQSLTGTTRQITVAGTPAAPVLSIPASPLLTAPEMVAAQPGPVFGPELAPPLASWTGNNGATWNGTAWTLPAGATISTTLAVTSGTMYQVDLTHPSLGQRPDAVQLGSVVQGTSEGANRSVVVTASGSGVQTLSVGGAAWASTLSGVSVRTVVPAGIAARAGVAELKAHGTNTSLGYLGLRSNTTGSYNSNVGHNGLSSNTTGICNNNVGYNGLSSNTTGSYNSNVGHDGLRNNTTGSRNSNVGHNGLRNNTTGSYNSNVGHNGLSSPRGTSSWATTTAGRQTSIGYAAGQGSAAQSDDITVVGYWAIADGAKAMALGSRSDARHPGSVALGSDTIADRPSQVAIGPRDLEVQHAAYGLVLRSPDGSRWRLTIDNQGVTAWTKL